MEIRVWFAKLRTGYRSSRESLIGEWVVNTAVVPGAAGSKESFTTVIYMKSSLATHFAMQLNNVAKLLVLILFVILHPDTPK